MMNLTLDEIAFLFGVSISEFDQSACDFYASHDFSYYQLSMVEKDKVILDILNFIQHDKTVVATPEREDVWQRGWSENLDSFLLNKDILSLAPKYLKSNQAVRLRQDYILPNNPYFERDFCQMLQFWLFKKYLTGYDNIYEFGCGSSFNLVAIANMFPKANIIGTDFVDSSITLVRKIAEHYDYKMKSLFFNMLKPDYKMEIMRNSCAFTFCSIEQLNNRFHNFIYFLLEKRPDICIHFELYDENNLVDYLAMKFHRKRQYPIGFLPFLQNLEKQGKLRIKKVKRLFCGGRNIEAYNHVIWEPC